MTRTPVVSGERSDYFTGVEAEAQTGRGLARGRAQTQGITLTGSCGDGSGGQALEGWVSPESPGWGLVHLDPGPLSGPRPQSLGEGLLGSSLLEQAVLEILEVGPARSVGAAIQCWKAPGWACPDRRIPHTRPRCWNVH